MPFRVFDKLKNDFQNPILRFCFYFNKEGEIQIQRRDSFFEFLMTSFVFHFHKKWKTKYSSFFVFHFNEEIEKRIP